MQRTRAAVVEAARALFMRKGYTGTTMEDVASAAGLTKRTVYNNYADKEALFVQIVDEMLAIAAAFARGLHQDFSGIVSSQSLKETLDDLARRLALGIMRPEVVALRRLLIGEAREFPALGATYFDRAPGQVLDALAAGFEQLTDAGLLRVPDSHLAAAQFAYLIVGEPLDRAMLVGALPTKDHIVSTAHAGVETFLARYQVTRTDDDERRGKRKGKQKEKQKR